MSQTTPVHLLQMEFEPRAYFFVEKKSRDKQIQMSETWTKKNKDFPPRVWNAENVLRNYFDLKLNYETGPDIWSHWLRATRSWSEQVVSARIYSKLLRAIPINRATRSLSRSYSETGFAMRSYSELNLLWSWCYLELEPEATQRPDLLFGASCSYRNQSCSELFVDRLGTNFTSFIISLVFWITSM